VPDSFLLGRYFSKIRGYILKSNEIVQISWLPYKIFDATVGYSVIYTFKRQPTVNLKHGISARLVKSNSDISDKKYIQFIYPQSYFMHLKYNRFRLFFDQDTKSIITKIEENTEELGSIVKFSSGLIAKNGQDTIISNIQKNNLWKPGIISGSEIKRYVIQPQGNFILYEKNSIKSGFECVNYFEKKLFMRQTGDSLICAIDDRGLLALNNIHIGNHVNDSYYLTFIVAIINSRLMDFFYRSISLETGRTMAQTDIETVETLPIKKVSVDKQKIFSELVDQIISLEDTESFASDKEKQKIAVGLEGQIDSMVYGLYGIKAEEIEIIENKLFK
jgi:hypothetical protein